MADSRFDLLGADNEFANLLVDENDARFWAEDLESAGTAPHLFPASEKERKRDLDKFGGYTEAEFLKLPPEQRLAIANRLEFERASKS